MLTALIVLIIILSFSTPMVLAISNQSTQNGTTKEHTIIGYKFFDLNGNGVLNPGEPGIPGVTIQLFKGDKLVATTTTNSSGYYNFRHLGVGDYTVNEILPAGHVNTSPSTVLATIGPDTDTLTVNFGDIAKVAYVANNGDDTISIIDLTTNTVINTIPGGGGPEYMVISPDNTRLYVDHCCGRDYVWVIDTATNTQIANITLPSGYELSGMAIKPDGTRVYVVGFVPVGPNSVLVIDTATNTLIDTIALPNAPVQIAVNPAGTRAYVTLGGDLSSDIRVSVIDLATDTVIDNIPVGKRPNGVAVSPDGTRAYVTNFGILGTSGRVSVINTATDMVIDNIPIGDFPGNVAFTPDGTKAYVTNLGSGVGTGYVSVIDTATNTIIATIPVEANPFDIAFTPDSARAYVTNEESASVSVIDTATNKVIDTISVGNNPEGIVILAGPVKS